MKMKYFMLFFGFVLIASNLVLADSTYYEENKTAVQDSDLDYIAISKLRYEPYPVSPGDYFTIWIQVRKSGSTKLDASFELLEDYPFSLDSNEEAIREIPDMGNEAVVLEYKVRVSDDAVSGLNTLKLRQSLETRAELVTEFDIYVEDVQTSFDAVVQDSSDNELSIALANIGLNDADAAIVRVPEQDGVVISGTNGQMIGNLEQGDYTIVAFTTSRAGSSIVLQIDYTDTIGVRRTEYLEVPLSSSYDSVQLNESNPFGDRPNFGEMQNESSWSWYTWFGVVVVLLVAGFFGRKYYLKNKSKKKPSGKVPTWVNKKKGA